MYAFVSVCYNYMFKIKKCWLPDLVILPIDVEVLTIIVVVVVVAVVVVVVIILMLVVIITPKEASIYGKLLILCYHTHFYWV